MPTAIAALIVTLQPILTNALSGPILNEKVSTKQWIGVLLGFAGAGLVLGFDVGSKIPAAGLAATTSLQSGGSAFFNYLNQKIRGEKTINKGEMAAASAASLIPGLQPFKAATRAGRFYKGVLRGGTTGVIDVTGTKLGRGEEVTPTDIVAGFGMGGTIGSIYGVKDGGEAFKALKNKVNLGKALV